MVEKEKENKNKNGAQNLTEFSGSHDSLRKNIIWVTQACIYNE